MMNGTFFRPECPSSLIDAMAIDLCVRHVLVHTWTMQLWVTYYRNQVGAHCAGSLRIAADGYFEADSSGQSGGWMPVSQGWSTISRRIDQTTLAVAHIVSCFQHRRAGNSLYFQGANKISERGSCAVVGQCARAALSGVMTRMSRGRSAAPTAVYVF